MGYSFLHYCCDQDFLLPPDARDWLPAGHLSWAVIDAVGELDLSEFLAYYRSDGQGPPAGRWRRSAGPRRPGALAPRPAEPARHPQRPAGTAGRLRGRLQRAPPAPVAPGPRHPRRCLRRPPKSPGRRPHRRHPRPRPNRPHRQNRARQPPPQRPPPPHRHRPRPRRNPGPAASPGPAHPRQQRRHRRAPARARPQPRQDLPAHRQAIRLAKANTATLRRFAVSSTSCDITARPPRRYGPTPRRCNGSPPPTCSDRLAGPAGSRSTAGTSSGGWCTSWTGTATPTPATSTAPCSSSSNGWPPKTSYPTRWPGCGPRTHLQAGPGLHRRGADPAGPGVYGPDLHAAPRYRDHRGVPGDRHPAGRAGRPPV